MLGLPRGLGPPGKPICEDLERAGWFAARHRLEHHVVAALRKWRAIPRAVKGDEDAAGIARREFAPRGQHQRQWRPVSGVVRQRPPFIGADADLLTAIAAVFR